MTCRGAAGYPTMRLTVADGGECELMGSLAPANIQPVIKAAKLPEIKIIAIIYYLFIDLQPEEANEQ